MSRRNISDILMVLLCLSMSLLTLNVAVKQVKAEADPWNIPVIYVDTYETAPNELGIYLAIYNLSNRYYTTNELWISDGPLGPYESGPARYVYSLGNLYGFDISISWNPSALSYASHEVNCPVETHPGGILHESISIVENHVDAVAGRYRIAYISNYPAAPFNNGDDAAQVFSMAFTVIGADDYGLNIDVAHLAVYPALSWGGVGIGGGTDHPPKILSSIQPEIPWRSIMDPHLPHNVAAEGARRNKNIIGGPEEKHPNGFGFTTYALLANKGDFEETFAVAIYADTTIVGTATTSIPARSTKKVGVVCSTNGLTKGYHTIRAVVTTVPNEIYTYDNEIRQGQIFVTLAGDVDGDRAVGIFDIVRMAGVYGIAFPNREYNPYCDIDNNGTIDLFDLVIAAGNYGKSW